MTELTVDRDEKLDRIVARALGVSRRIARILIGEGAIEVNGKPWRIVAKPVKAGARVRITREAPPEDAPLGPQLDADAILHLDPSIVVIDKPSGLLSETDRVGSTSLQTLVPQLLERQGERQRDVWLVHRLDAGTSGVIVLARSAAAARAVDAVFRESRAAKEYLALCSGRMHDARPVDAPIGRAQGTRHKVDPVAGKPAFTQLTPLRIGTSATLVEAKPRTGRTHQIRVHLAHVGHPIMGDRLYGGPAYTASTPPKAVGRVMLHARALTIPHPKSGTQTRFEALVPKDFVALGEALGVIDAL